MTKSLEQIALESGDKEKWAQIKRGEGEVLPTDVNQLDSTFHLRRMRMNGMPLQHKLESRKVLGRRGVVRDKDEPLTPLEILAARGARWAESTDIRKLLEKDIDVVVLVFEHDLGRFRFFTKVAARIQGQLDNERSNLKDMTLITLEGKTIMFVLLWEELPDIHDGLRVAYRVINDVT